MNDSSHDKLMSVLNAAEQSQFGDAYVPTGDIELPILSEVVASYGVDEILQGVIARFDRLRAMEVEYHQHTRSFDWSEHSIPFGRYHFGFSGCKRFLAQSNAGNREAFVYPHVVWAWNGRIQQTLDPEDSCAYIESDFMDFIKRDLYTMTVSIPTSLDSETHARQRGDPAQVWKQWLLDKSREWVVLPQMEMVDGAACHVLRSQDRGKLWIDPSIDYAVRFRESHRHLRSLTIDEWPLSSRCAFRDYRCIDGIWLPWRVEVVRYVDDPAFDTIFGQPASASIYVVEQMSINESVSDQLFTLSLTPGTIVRDKVNRLFYRIGDSGEQIKLGDWE